MKYIKIFESFNEDENLIIDLFTEYADKYSLFEVDKIPTEEDTSRYNGCYLLDHRELQNYTKKYLMYIQVFDKMPPTFIYDIEYFAKKLKVNGFSFSKIGRLLGGKYWVSQPAGKVILFPNPDKSYGTLYKLYINKYF